MKKHEFVKKYNKIFGKISQKHKYEASNTIKIINYFSDTVRERINFKENDLDFFFNSFFHAANN